MLTVPHVLVGSAIGVAVSQVPGAPLVAFGLGWLSHYALDSVPHWERLYRPHEEINFETDHSINTWPRHIFVQAVLDVLAAAFIVYLIISVKNAGTFAWNSPILWGAIGAFLPDFLDNVPLWNRTLSRWPIFGSEARLHQSVHITEAEQQRFPRYYGLLTQVVAVSLSLAVIIRYH